jgi:hypothetical protein
MAAISSPATGRRRFFAGGTAPLRFERSQFRRIIGHADLARLALAVERQLHRHTAPTQEVTACLT